MQSGSIRVTSADDIFASLPSYLSKQRVAVSDNPSFFNQKEADGCLSQLFIIIYYYYYCCESVFCVVCAP